jgi:hypothetical protein
VYRSRLQRAGLFVWGLFMLAAAWAAYGEDAQPLVVIGLGGFGVASVVLAAVPRQTRGSHEGVEQTTTVVDGVAQPTLVFRGGRGRAIAGAVGGTAFTLTGAMLLLGPPVAMVIGAVAVLFFGLCSIIAVRQAIRGSYVALTPDALSWSGGAGHYSVPWDAIEAVWRHSTQGVEELYIRLDDPSKLRGSGVVKALARFSRRFIGAEVAVPLAHLSADPDVVEEEVQRALARRPGVLHVALGHTPQE